MTLRVFASSNRDFDLQYYKPQINVYLIFIKIYTPKPSIIYPVDIQLTLVLLQKTFKNTYSVSEEQHPLSSLYNYFGKHCTRIFFDIEQTLSSNQSPPHICSAHQPSTACTRACVFQLQTTNRSLFSGTIKILG